MQGGYFSSQFSLCLSSMCLEITLSLDRKSSLNADLSSKHKKIESQKKAYRSTQRFRFFVCGLVCYWRKNRRRERLLGCGQLAGRPAVTWKVLVRAQLPQPLSATPESAVKILNDAC